MGATMAVIGLSVIMLFCEISLIRKIKQGLSNGKMMVDPLFFLNSDNFNNTEIELSRESNPILFWWSFVGLCVMAVLILGLTVVFWVALPRLQAPS